MPAGNRILLTLPRISIYEALCPSVRLFVHSSIRWSPIRLKRSLRFRMSCPQNRENHETHQKTQRWPTTRPFVFPEINHDRGVILSPEVRNGVDDGW